MTSPFLITALPRSRTAWFAVATSVGGKNCLHEPTATMEWSLLKTMWAAGVIDGVSDHGLAPRLPEILADIQPRTLIIDRPIKDVVASMRAYLEPQHTVSPAMIDRLWEVCEDLQTHLAIQHPLIMRVRYGDLNSLSLMNVVFQHLGVEPRGLAQMMRMNVQSSLAYNMALLRAKAA